MSAAVTVALLVLCFLAGAIFGWSCRYLQRPRPLSARARMLLAEHGARR